MLNFDLWDFLGWPVSQQCVLFLSIGIVYLVDMSQEEFTKL